MCLMVYLAGTRFLPWRQTVIEECVDCQIHFLSPLPNKETNKTFHIEDMLKIESAQIVFAYFQDESDGLFSGTSLEVGYALGKGKIVMAVCDMDSGRMLNYDLVLKSANAVYPTLSDGIDGLRHIALSMIYKPKED